MTRFRRPPTLALVAIAFTWLMFPMAMVVAEVIHQRVLDAGGQDLNSGLPVALAFTVPITSAALVGSALVARRPEHPAGWLFLALTLVVVASAPMDEYSALGAAKPGAYPGAASVAIFADRTWMFWLMLVALILLYTPEPRLKTRFRRWTAWTAIACATITFCLSAFRPYDGPIESAQPIRSPLEVADPAVFNVIGIVLVVVLHLAVLCAGVSLLSRFRTSRGSLRRQVRWVAGATVLFLVFVGAAYISATTGQEAVLIFLGFGFVAVLPIGAGLAIERDHLYGIDRLVSRGLTYLLLSAALVTCYVLVVLFTSQSLGDFGGQSQAPAIIATLAAVSIAAPARRWLQSQLDRRFHRRQYEAVARIRRYLVEPDAALSVEDGMRGALDDPRLTVAYWIEERGQWVSEVGESASPGADAFVAKRRGAVVAAITPVAADPRALTAVVHESLTELENARLRAAIAIQLVEVKESRARVVAAQLAERHKMERDLHDGAQQRLLALAFQLRAAQVSGDPARSAEALSHGVDEIQVAVRELRDLANGLYPSVLTDGGLTGAFEDLAHRVPVPMRVDAPTERYTPALEQTAWFIACEAVTNAVKHASSNLIAVSVERDDTRLRLTIEDDGVGGANADGEGLRGLADRAEAVGGSLSIRERPGRGTLVVAELPCGW
ncbi:hypothetical protein AYO38_00830 [bacterium SCGC AG-212-C10]|nr:hypothetical protein AYO38_00830 [bacterium SCGC AG-212-C10]